MGWGGRVRFRGEELALGGPPGRSGGQGDGAGGVGRRGGDQGWRIWERGKRKPKVRDEADS